MFVGILLILLGALMMLDKLGIIEGGVGDFFVPIAIIALGGSFLFKNKKDID